MKRVVLLAVLLSFGLLHGSLVAEVPEHPVIRPFPGSVLAEAMSKHVRFDAHEFRYRDEATKQSTTKTVKGEYWSLLYEVRTPSGERVTDISVLEFFENFKQAALEMGGKVVYEDTGYLVFTLPKDDGGTTWCEIMPVASMGQVYMRIIDEKGLKTSLTFGPDQLHEAIERDGKVLLYGILFDIDKANLKQESDKQLQHIVTLLVKHPELKLEIQGHTDDQGEADYNMDLSQRRAETVQTYLKVFGIEPGRLVAKGYGESQPVASNDTEEGRSKNRRVELVKME
jgi:outer membrane protein OmpA-like peptidoglycan-associated protein